MSKSVRQLVKFENTYTKDQDINFFGDQVFIGTESQLEDFLSDALPSEWSIGKLYFEDPYSHSDAYVSIVIKYHTLLRDRTADELNAEHDEIANLIVQFINKNLTVPEEFGYEENRVEGWQM